MKYCNGCKATKPLTDFNTNKSKGDGYQTTCKSCRSDYNKRHYLKNKDKYKERSSNWRINNPIRNLANKYSVSEYEILDLIRLYPVCAICSSEDDLVIDHCHVTGNLRGRLCGRCNRVLGSLGDDLEGVISFSDGAISYLKMNAEEELKE